MFFWKFSKLLVHSCREFQVLHFKFYIRLFLVENLIKNFFKSKLFGGLIECN